MNLKLLIIILVSILFWLVFQIFNDYPIVNKENGNKGIIALGDSWTQGVGASKGRDYVSQLEKLTGKEILNFGISGNTSKDLLSRLDEVEALEFGCVILLIGGNDLRIKMPISDTEKNVTEIIKKMQSKNAMVVLVGFSFPMIGSYDKLYKKLSKENGCLYINNVLDGVFLNPKLMADQVHPNDKGYEVFAEKIYRHIFRYVQ